MHRISGRVAALAVAFCGALLSAPALAVNPTFQNLGNALACSSGTSTCQISSTSNDCPLASLVVLAASYTTIASTLSSGADGTGLNTWTSPVDNTTVTGLGIGVAYAIVTTDIPIGSTLTATFAGNTASSVSAICIKNYGGQASPLDKHNNTANGTGTSATTVSTGTLTQAGESIIGLQATSLTSGTLTCNGSFTRSSDSNSTPSIGICTQYVTGSASVSFAPSWVNSRTYVVDVVSFLGPPPAAASPGTMFHAFP